MEIIALARTSWRVCFGASDNVLSFRPRGSAEAEANNKPQVIRSCTYLTQLKKSPSSRLVLLGGTEHASLTSRRGEEPASQPANQPSSQNGLPSPPPPTVIVPRSATMWWTRWA